MKARAKGKIVKCVFIQYPHQCGLAIPRGGAKRLSGIFVGSRSMLEDLNRFIEAAKIHPVVDRVFQFGEARHAYEYLKGPKHFGKVVIEL